MSVNGASTFTQPQSGVLLFTLQKTLAFRNPGRVETNSTASGALGRETFSLRRRNELRDGFELFEKQSRSLKSVLSRRPYYTYRTYFPEC